MIARERAAGKGKKRRKKGNHATFGWKIMTANSRDDEIEDKKEWRTKKRKTRGGERNQTRN